MTQSQTATPVITNGAMVAGGTTAVMTSASLAAQAYLAAQAHATQSQLATASTANALAIWSALNLQDVRSSWPALRTGLSALIRDGYSQSAAQGIQYYQQARQAAGLTGPSPDIEVPALPDAQIQATLDSTGPYNLLGKIKQGQQIEQATQNAGIQMSGAAQQLITTGGRQVMLQLVTSVGEAVAWARITSSNPCAFCAMLASRGPVFHNEKSAGFIAHWHCHCFAMPIFSYKDAKVIRQDNPLYSQWQQATKGTGGKDALNAWRRYWDGQQNRDGVRVLPAA